MNKDYQKPEVEYVSFVTEEITSLKLEDNIVDGEMGLESNIFG